MRHVTKGSLSDKRMEGRKFPRVMNNKQNSKTILEGTYIVIGDEIFN